MSLRCMTLACAPYDRTLPLADGRVAAKGLDLNVLLLTYEQTFWRMLRHREFAASELSLSSYLMASDRGQDDLIAIPVFPSRVFRHSAIYVRGDSALESPGELRGASVGVPEYQMTAAVWTRGILQDEYGVGASEIHWHNGGLDEPGRIEKLALDLPGEIRLTPIPVSDTLTEWLLEGRLDAVVTARPPSAFLNGTGEVRRLVRDYATVEADYYARTGIFPPMHTVVLRRDVYESDRWIATSLYEAFQEALALCDPLRMFDGHLRYALPFLHAAVEELVSRYGGLDMWRYGLEPNRKALETLVRYQREQGLTRGDTRLEDVFAPETLDASRN